MQNGTDHGEKRTFWQWISFAVPYIYTAIIGFILIWMLFSIVNLIINGHSLISTSDETSTVQSSGTLFDLVIRPIIQSELYQIIFHGIVLIFLLVLLSLMIPVGLLRVRKLRLFRMEFEVEERQMQKRVVKSIEINGAKARLMAYFSSDEALGRTFNYLVDDNTINYIEVLEGFMKELQEGYYNTFNSAFSFEIHKEDFPPSLAELIAASKEIKEPVYYNKIENENPFRKNQLIYYYEFDNQKIVLELNSYTTQFDIFDKYVIQLVTNILFRYIENIENTVALTEPAN